MDELRHNTTHKKKYKRVSTASIEEALFKNAGLLTQTAKALGVDRTVIYRRMKKFPALQAKRKEAEEMSLDIAEGMLLVEIQKGNLAAIIFYLKCKGKSRGYVERQEIAGTSGEPLKVVIERIVTDKRDTDKA